ncbi:hypothetical protein BGZ97_001471 [Linnemannia gamsii]|uniref:Uncharacterized protein n=1 Tax=Linnemannia gamsii TaxID=64522 RepID=A0A9P6QXR7_9FUNG|nr:hypothetical protein BGZ97_001471 [Linnemannia gamsii]
MGPHLDREHRKLAVTANASATVAATSISAQSTKTSSSNRKERMRGATTSSSNISPSATAGKATMSREGGRQTKAEPVVEHADAAITIHTTTPAEHTNVIYDKSATQHLDIRSDAIPKVTTTATLTTAMNTLLPPLRMKGDEESPTVIECPRLAQDRTPAPTKVVTIAPSPPSPSLPPPPPYEAKAEMLLPILNSPIMVASSHLKTPSPPTKIVILHESPSSDIVPQTPETPSVAASSPPKEMPPIVQEHQEPTEVGLAQPPAAGMATALSKSHTSSGVANSTPAHTSISAPPTFLSGTSKIFRVLRETSRPCLLGGIQQQQQQLKSASQSDEYTEGGGRERRVGVNTNIHRSKSGELVPFTDEPMGTLTALPIALTATSILTATPVTESSTRDETSGPQNQQQQPFRKNIWNGRMERFNKPRSTTSLHEEAIPTTQGTISDRTGLLAAMETTVLRAPLTKIKDPAVMRDLMALAKERRASRTLCDIVVEDGPSAAQYGSGNQFKDRSRKMTTKHEHRSDNDNDTLTTTTSTTKYNNQNSNNRNSNYATINPLSASTPSRKITLEDKRAFLKTQETLRRNNLRRSRDLQTVDPPISSPNYPFPPSPSPAAVAQDSLTVDIHPGFPCSQGHVATQPIPAMVVYHDAATVIFFATCQSHFYH